MTSARYYVYFLLITTITFFSVTFPIIYDIKGDIKRKKCVIRPNYGLVHRVYQPIVMYGIPDVLLLSNLYTVYSLIRRHMQQSSNNENLDMRVSDVNSNRKQRQLTIMLVTVSLAFYLFTTPAMIIYIAEYSPPKHRDLYKLKRSFLVSQMSVPILQLHNAVSLKIKIYKYHNSFFFNLDKFYILLCIGATLSSSHNGNIDFVFD